MARTLTKQAIKFAAFSVERRTDDEGRPETVIRVAYTVTTDDPDDPLRRKREHVLSGGALTRANNMFAAVLAALEAREGIA